MLAGLIYLERNEQIKEILLINKILVVFPYNLSNAIHQVFFFNLHSGFVINLNK